MLTETLVSRHRAGLPHLSTLLLLALLTAAPARAQAPGLEDGQVLVVTSDGLFLVGPEPATQQLLTSADFGLDSLCEPSVTWIDQTSTFVVSSSRSCGGGAQLFQVRIHAGPTASVSQVAVVGLDAGSPKDAVYDPAHDRMWILDGAEARVYAWDQPGTGSSAVLELVHQLDVDEPSDIALYGVAEPGALLVSQRHLLQKLLPDGTVEVLWQWQAFGQLAPPRDVAVHGLKDEVYILRPAVDGVDILENPNMVVPLNTWPTFACTKRVALDPADLDWDYDSKRLVVLAARGVNCFEGGALSEEPNHIVGLRGLAPLAGEGDQYPVLLTPSPSSGITGADPDLAQVRFDRPGLIHYGQATAPQELPLPTSHTVALAEKLELGSSLQAQLEQALPGSPAWLVVGLQDQPLVLKGALLFPSPDLVLPVTTDGVGQVQLELAIPVDPLLAGLELRTQWLVTPPGAAASASWATWMRLAD